MFGQRHDLATRKVNFRSRVQTRCDCNSFAFFQVQEQKNNCEKQCYFFLTMTFPPTARKQSCTKCYDQNGLHPMQWQAKRLISQYHTHLNKLGEKPETILSQNETVFLTISYWLGTIFYSLLWTIFQTASVFE